MDINSKVKEIQSLRDQGLYAESDRIRGELTDMGVLIEIERDGSIFWWSGKRRHNRESGAILQNQDITPKQHDALIHLLDRTFELRKPFYIGRYYIAEDRHYRTRDELIDILIGKDMSTNEAI